MFYSPAILVDGYKTGHPFQYPEDTNFVFANTTPRASRLPVDRVVHFGLQYFLKRFTKEWNDGFFNLPKDDALRPIARRLKNYLGSEYDMRYYSGLHDLGYLPIEIHGVDEGTTVPLRVPMFTIQNTGKYGWVTNSLETILSNSYWTGATSATIALRYRKLLNAYADETVGNRDFVQYQAHDFSFRGMGGLDAAMSSGAAHGLCFVGSDTVPAIDFLEHYYGANSDNEVVLVSVPATEHSVMSMGTKDNELGTFRRLIHKVHPTGIVSIVSDTWDFWKVVTEFIPILKQEILNRKGKVVIRPDSGDPVKIVCGDPNAPVGSPEYKGAVECLWDTFKGTFTKKGYRQLDDHIGLIYGDSITYDRAQAILEGLKRKGFASNNIVLGIGSYTYQYNTRDTFGFAVKTTYGEVTGIGQEVWKDPKTDDGTKKSARGLLGVNGDTLIDRLNPDEYNKSFNTWNRHKLIFKNGKLIREFTLKELRDNIEKEV